MKRYNINWHNGWRFFWEVLGVVTIYTVWIFFTVIFLATFRIVGIGFLIFLAFIIFYQRKRFISGLINCFYFDDKNNQIILKLIGRKKVRIPIAYIEKISPKINENPRKGAVTTISEGSNTGEVKQKTFAVRDIEGNDLFYICKDPMIFELFESLGVTIIYNDE